MACAISCSSVSSISASVAHRQKLTERPMRCCRWWQTPPRDGAKSNPNVQPAASSPAATLRARSRAANASTSASEQCDGACANTWAKPYGTAQRSPSAAATTAVRALSWVTVPSTQAPWRRNRTRLPAGHLAPGNSAVMGAGKGRASPQAALAAMLKMAVWRISVVTTWPRT